MVIAVRAITGPNYCPSPPLLTHTHTTPPPHIHTPDACLLCDGVCGDSQSLLFPMHYSIAWRGSQVIPQRSMCVCSPFLSPVLRDRRTDGRTDRQACITSLHNSHGTHDRMSLRTETHTFTHAVRTHRHTTS
jgi:hypothetical protein